MVYQVKSFSAPSGLPGGRLSLLLPVLLILGALCPVQARADTEQQFVLNSFAFLIWGVLVMWMCAGFTMLESGSVRTKNASVICLKNIGLYSIAGLTFYLVGYNLLYGDGNSFIGSFSFLYGHSPEELTLLGIDPEEKERVAAAASAVLDSAVRKDSIYSTLSDWFFQMVFVATTASIVSGSLAERVKLWSFFVFIAILTAFIYPVVGAWTWGGGWLDDMGFRDFAGSTIVHSTGGWAALAGAIMVGARRGKFREDGSVKPTPPSNVPVVTLGVFILWMGWFGFNGGSKLAMSGTLDLVAISGILVNTNLAAAAGVMSAMIFSRAILGRIDLLGALNGGIAGLVAITAAPDITEHHAAILIGGVGGVLCLLGVRFLEKMKVDDVVGAIPAHLVAGIWGTLAVALDKERDLATQAIGVAAVGAFVFLASLLAWWIISLTMGARISQDVEDMGQDSAELGIETYPEFVLMPEDD